MECLNLLTWKRICKIVSIPPNFKGKKYHRGKIGEMKSQHVFLHGLSSPKHLFIDLCNSEACGNHSWAAAGPELPKAGVISTPNCCLSVLSNPTAVSSRV